MPEGFPKLQNLTTDRFDVKATGHTTVLTSELDKPVRLLGNSMKLEDVSMNFKYQDTRRKEGRWEFHAEGIPKIGSKCTSRIIYILYLPP